MEQDIQTYFTQIEAIEREMFKEYSMDEIQAMVLILGKLLENIINNDDVKYRSINRQNKVLKEKLFKVKQIVRILEMHGWRLNQADDRFELTGNTYLVDAYRLRYIQSQWSSMVENRSELDKYRNIVNEQRQNKIKEDIKQKQKQALEDQSKKDRREKNQEEVKASKCQLNNGFGAKNTTFKDIGVDLNAQPRGR